MNHSLKVNLWNQLTNKKWIYKTNKILTKISTASNLCKKSKSQKIYLWHPIKRKLMFFSQRKRIPTFTKSRIDESLVSDILSLTRTYWLISFREPNPFGWLAIVLVRPGIGRRGRFINRTMFRWSIWCGRWASQHFISWSIQIEKFNLQFK